MKVIKEFSSNKFIYDNTKKLKNVLDVILDNLILKINFDDIINTQFSLGNISKDEVEKVKNFLNMGLFYNDINGGFINFYKIKIKEREFIVFSGVNEISNSHYIITLHKIIEC